MNSTKSFPTETNGKVRIRFETLSQRLQRINVDIHHKNPESFALREDVISPDGGELGCFLADELERLRTLDTSSNFKRYCICSSF